MPATGIEKQRRSRITAACAVCRQKRQKCSGEKPVCDQCRLHKEECWWSDQKKRGPAKDYLRSLQDRLQETETLLLGILNQIPDHGLSVAIQQDKTVSHQTWTSSMSGQEYWARYPLNRVDGIRQWQLARNSGLNLVRPLDQARVDPPLPAQEAKMRLADPASSINVAEVPPVGTQDTSALSHESVQNWPQIQANTMEHREERYSEEARDVAQTLYSISNQGHTFPTGDPPQPGPDRSHEDMAISPDLETLPSRFPKHLFW